MSDRQELPPAARRVLDWATDQGLDLEIVEYPEDGARTAQDAASAVGCAVDQIVKSMIFAARPAHSKETNQTDPGQIEPGVESELVLALTSGANQVDSEALAELAGSGACGRAKPDDVRTATGYAIGGVPPFGHSTPLRTWIDPHLLTFDRVWAAAGTPRHVFPIAPTALVEVTGAEPGSFTTN